MSVDLLVAPGFVAHDASSVDLAVRLRKPRGALAGGATEARDLEVVEGRENIAQALLLRLLTPLGALTALGHAGYGSRLHELIGERKTPALRNLCRTYVLEAVSQEPRIEDRALALDFDLAAETASSFSFTLAVTPRLRGSPVLLGLEVSL